jgi:flagellin
MFRINTNIASLNAQRSLNNVTMDLETRLERLSSGLRINQAADDAAGLTASESMRAQLIGQRTSNDNISRAITMLQSADSGLEQIGNMLVRLKELATQAADDTLNASNRSAISAEASALVNEIERIAESTNFNGTALINSGMGSVNLTFFIGDGTSSVAAANQTAAIQMKGVDFDVATGLGSIGQAAVVMTIADFMTRSSAEALVTVADTAANSVAQIRTEIGAFQNRLERTQSNLQVAIENTANAESTIRDADFAEEAAALTRAQILVQAGTSMLAQANLLPQAALTFFA